jgi:hypothetical protein
MHPPATAPADDDDEKNPLSLSLRQGARRRRRVSAQLSVSDHSARALFLSFDRKRGRKERKRENRFL